MIFVYAVDGFGRLYQRPKEMSICAERFEESLFVCLFIFQRWTGLLTVFSTWIETLVEIPFCL